MKKLFLYVFLVLMICNVAKALSLMPLREVIEKNANSNTDPAFQVYVFNRCAGAYEFSAEIFLKANKKDIATQFVEFSSKFSTMAGVVLVTKLNYSQDDALKKVKESLKEMGSLYAEDGKENYLKTGSHLEGSYILDDVKVCSLILKK